MDTNLSATPSPTRNEPKTKPASKVRYNRKTAALICVRIATTPQSMAQICEAPDMPGIATFFRWLRDYPEFREMYVIAKQEQVEILIEECIDIVDDASHDVIVTKDGRTILNPVAVQRAKLQVSFRQWTAAKLLPRKYGNQAQLDAAAPPPPPPPPPPAGGGMILTKELLLAIQARRQKDILAWEEAKKTNPNAPWPPRD